MSEVNHSVENKSENNIENKMSGGGMSMRKRFIKKYYDFIKKYKFILFFFTTITLGFLTFKKKPLINLDKNQTLA